MTAPDRGAVTPKTPLHPRGRPHMLAGVQPHLMVTDPPYGVDYNPSWRNEAGVSATLRTGRVANDHRADWREAWALFPGDVAYVWHAGVHARNVIESLEAAGFGYIHRLHLVEGRPIKAICRDLGLS